jgi:hypothetical protein
MHNESDLLFSKLNEYFKNKISLSLKAYKKLFICTKNDEFYEIDVSDSRIASFALKNDNSVINSFIVEKLCNMKIIDLNYGPNYFIAKTSRGEFFCWGSNRFGQLANGKRDEKENNKPKLNEYLGSLNINIIECGPFHALALTCDQQVYAWGLKHSCKTKGLEDVIQYVPTKLNGFGDENIVMISCGSKHSMALTETGHVYGWGNNEWGQLGFEGCDDCFEPKLVELNNVIIKKICCGHEHSLLLTNDGIIFAFGVINSENDETTKVRISFRLKTNKYKFIDILSHYSIDIIASLSEDNVYYVWKQAEDSVLEPIKTKFKSFDKIIAKNYEINLKPMKKLIKLHKPFLREGYYKENYNEIKIIGEGSFGTVFKSSIKSSSQERTKCVAIKKINLENIETSIREYLNYHKVNKLNSKYVVQHYDAWFENANDINDNKYILFIEMKLCEETLENLIKELHETMKENGMLTKIGYHIASELFIEILECMKYLHDQDPPLIHRDLKPANILLIRSKNSKRTVKISDFGLTAIHKFAEQSHSIDKGTPKYMAPEVVNGQKYDMKADIYSLGEIMKDLFDIDFERYLLVK